VEAGRARVQKAARPTDHALGEQNDRASGQLSSLPVRRRIESTRL
jgi:hypothetical protein